MSTACRLLQNMSCLSPWWLLTVHPAATVLPSGPCPPAPSPAKLAFLIIAPRAPSSLTLFLLFSTHSGSFSLVTRGTGQVIIPDWLHLSSLWGFCVFILPLGVQISLTAVVSSPFLASPLLLDTSELTRQRAARVKPIPHRVPYIQVCASFCLSAQANNDFPVIA